MTPTRFPRPDYRRDRGAVDLSLTTVLVAVLLVVLIIYIVNRL